MKFYMLAILLLIPSLGEAIEVKTRPFTKNMLMVTVTAYTPSVEECDSTPTITASNKKVQVGYIALSRDLEKRFNFKFGDKLFLIGQGYLEFQDRMHYRKRRQIDIFMWSKIEALEFGRQKGILVVNQQHIYYEGGQSNSFCFNSEFVTQYIETTTEEIMEPYYLQNIIVTAEAPKSLSLQDIVITTKVPEPELYHLQDVIVTAKTPEPAFPLWVYLVCGVLGLLVCFLFMWICKDYFGEKKEK